MEREFLLFYTCYTYTYVGTNHHLTIYSCWRATNLFNKCDRDLLNCLDTFRIRNKRTKDEDEGHKIGFIPHHYLI